MKKLIFMVAGVLVLSACSLGKDIADQNTALIRQNKEVNDLYGPLVGTYGGKLRATSHGDEDVQLIIYISNVAVTNPDGSPGSKDVPLAYFRRDNPVIADYSMDVSGYRAEEGNLSLRNLGEEAVVRTVRAHVAGGEISGPVLNREGTLGQLDVRFISSDTSSRNDLKERLLRRYQAVQGLYVGTIPHSVPLRKLSIALTATMNGDKPRLDGYYKNKNVPDGQVDLALIVSYRPDMSPPEITMNGRGGLKYAMDFDGTLSDDTMTVSVTSPFFEGFIGIATLKRATPSSPDSEQEELYGQYQAVQGKYRGDLVIGNRRRPATVELIAGHNGRLAILTANYLVTGDAASEMFLKVDYTLANGAIVMSGKTEAGSSRRLRGTLKDGVLSFKLLKGNTVLGSARLTR